jgi:hypothetical protein
MNEAPPVAVPPISPDFKDRRAWMMVFGIVQILCGLLAGLMIPLMILGQVMAARVTQDAAPLRQMVAGVAFYGVVAVGLIWVGTGSCLARRWGRALSLVVAWSWLLMGVITLGFMAVLLPTVLRASAQQGQAMPEMVQKIVLGVAFVVTAVMGVVVPTILVLFYRSQHVKATSEARDPVPRWTDASPLPVLGLSLWLGLGALVLLLMPVSANGVLPVFGRLVSGPVGWLISVLLAAMLAYLAVAMYRLKPISWWLAVALMVVGAASAVVTFSRVDLLDMYRLMGYGDRQIEMMKPYLFLQGRGMGYLSAGGSLLWLGYLLWVKRFFRRKG